MSETLRGRPPTTTITAEGAQEPRHGPALDHTVSFFPSLAQMHTLESGLPLVWVYNRWCTGTLMLVDGRPFIASNGTTAQGNLRAHPFEPHVGDGVLDDRWRIDLRTPIGFGFGLRWLESGLYRVLATDDSGWRKLCWSHFRGATNDDERAALARAIQEVKDAWNIGGEV